MGTEMDISEFNVMNQDWSWIDLIGRTPHVGKTRWCPYLLLKKKTSNNNIKADSTKQEDNMLVCRRHILNTLYNTPYAFITSMKSPRKIWNSSEFQ